MELFIDNKYTKRYMNIIESCKQRVLEIGVVYEKHHIIPKSLGGNDKKSNIVHLTCREHFIVHWLLTKMCVQSDHKRKMWYALSCFRKRTIHQNRFFTAGQYEILRKAHYNSIKGENHPCFNKPHSQQRKDKISAKHIGMTASNETKRKMSVAHQGNLNGSSKMWTIISPSGIIHILNGNLQKFCDDNKILAPTLRYYRNTIVPNVKEGSFGGYRAKTLSSKQYRDNTTGWMLQ